MTEQYGVPVVGSSGNLVKPMYGQRWVGSEQSRALAVCDDSASSCACTVAKNERLAKLLMDAIGFVDKLMWLENEYGMHEVADAVATWRAQAKAEVG